MDNCPLSLGGNIIFLKTLTKEKIMPEKKEITVEDAHKKFEEACVKFETWTELYENDDNFDINSEAEKDLQELKQEHNTPELIAKFNAECEGLTTFEDEIKKFEAQILFNQITDTADLIYADILKYAKIIAPHLDKLGLDKEKFEIRVYNMGICKMEIDDDKEMNEEFADEPIYPQTEKVEPILDEEKLSKYLFG